MLPDAALAAWAAAAAAVGLAVGSVLNVVIDAVPAGERVGRRPVPRCPSCDEPLRGRRAVPVFGWLASRGRCTQCDTAISARYPTVEAVTALLFAAMTWRIPRLDLPGAVPAYLWFSAIGVALTVIDIQHKRLPDKIVLPSYAVTAVLLVLASAISGDWGALGRAAIAAAILFAAYFLVAFAYPPGMGFGDVKLSGLVGGLLGYLSWSALAVGALGAFLLAAVGAIALMASRRGNRKSEIPFGPYMIVAALAAIFVAHPIARAYLDLITR